ncbi:hypothetical protein MP228_004464 [Amoeboaphelidium protococcarum]|nr:hypothetical protein MP228_004464 [Amoeboaphelidium protococcarum]
MTLQNNINSQKNDVTIIGKRFEYHGYLGTVKYYGKLHSRQGEELWFGVEWDDSSRGKHSGSLDGVQYFKCKQNGAGSFIKASVKLDFGRDFLEVYQEKYLESFQLDSEGFGSANVDTSLRRSNMKTIQTVDLSRCRVSSLDGLLSSLQSQNITSGKACMNLRDTLNLDLSYNLINDLSLIIQCCHHLTNLKVLNLSGNHFDPQLHARDVQQLSVNTSVETLILNNVDLSPQSLQVILNCLPNVKELHLDCNNIDDKIQEFSVLLQLPQILYLSLQRNSISDMTRVVSWVYCHFPNVRHLELSHNMLQIVETVPRSLDNLFKLNISHNKVSTWMEIDNLNRAVPNLEWLKLVQNPLVDGGNGEHCGYALDESYDRFMNICIARCPKLQYLNGVQIQEQAITKRLDSYSRRDAELYYLSVIEKEVQALVKRYSEEQSQLEDQSEFNEAITRLRLNNYRLEELCVKYSKDLMIPNDISQLKSISKGATNPNMISVIASIEKDSSAKNTVKIQLSKHTPVKILKLHLKRKFALQVGCHVELLYEVHPEFKEPLRDHHQIGFYMQIGQQFIECEMRINQ